MTISHPYKTAIKIFYISLTLYPQIAIKHISDIPENDLVMRNTKDVTGKKPSVI
jgi:hypothetical protein